MIQSAVTLTKPEVTVPARTWLVVGLTCVATTIGWYSFFIFGSLTAPVGPAFFPKAHPWLAQFASLSSFGIAFLVRPLGAIWFGRKGDRDGRKKALVGSSFILGAATAGIGVIPRYETIGVAAPVIMVLLRVVQGLALGGQHGIASVYIAELVTEKKIGLWTSFVQLTVTVGLLASLAVVYGLGVSISSQAFNGWGWRLPFIFASVLAILSLYLNRGLSESPLFISESAGRVSSSQTSTWKLVLLGLFGATAGQGVLWYTSQFQTQFFLQEVLRVQSHSAITILVAALLLSLPFFVLFGWLSDKIGAKRTVTIGCLFAALLLYPIYRGIAAATRSEAISIRLLKSPSSGGMKLTPVANQSDGSFKVLNVVAKPVIVALVVLVFVQSALVALVSGPIAAYLVKRFPTNRRCTCVSLSYQLGNSVFGGALPLISLAVISSTSSIYSWLLYPVAVLLLTFLIGFFIVRADAKSQYHLR